MKAIQVFETGGPEKLQLVELPVPAPGPGQVLVKVAAAGVNFIDIYYRNGLYRSPLPLSCGVEAAGTVEAVGAGVGGVAPGDAVAWCMAPGAYAGFAVVPAAQLVKVPDGMDLKLAAAVMLQGMTAHYLTHSTFPLKPGHTALIHAASGGTGLLLVQMAKMLGARVIGTVSLESKAALARQAGADHIVIYSQQDFVPEAKAFAGGSGVDVVYDSVGAATFTNSLDALRPRGMMVTFGNASGPVPAVEPLLLNQKGSLFLTRPSLGHYIATPEELRWRANDVLGWAASGKLSVRIHRTYPLEDAAQAQIDLASRATSGKLLLLP